MANNQTVTNDPTAPEAMRDELWTIRDKLTLFITMHERAIKKGAHYEIMYSDMNKAASKVDDAIYAINIAIAKNECKKVGE